MDQEELECLAKQLKHEIETEGRASATLLYNEETNRAEIMARLGSLLGEQNLKRVDLKLIYNDFDDFDD